MNDAPKSTITLHISGIPSEVIDAAQAVVDRMFAKARGEVVVAAPGPLPILPDAPPDGAHPRALRDHIAALRTIAEEAQREAVEWVRAGFLEPLNKDLAKVRGELADERARAQVLEAARQFIADQPCAGYTERGYTPCIETGDCVTEFCLSCYAKAHALTPPAEQRDEEESDHV